MLYPDQFERLSDLADQFWAVDSPLGNISTLMRELLDSEKGQAALVDTFAIEKAKYDEKCAFKAANGARVAGELLGDMIP